MITRYSRKELTTIWSEENKYKIWLDVEIAAAQAMEKYKFIPKGVSKIVKNTDDAMHRCPNVSCPAQFFELLKHFVSKGAMNIDGLGEKWCNILIQQGLINDISDLYKLRKSDLVDLERMGDILATKIISNIEQSKTNTLATFLFSLGIFHVGSEVAELLAAKYDNLTSIIEASHEDLISIQGIGPKIAGSIVSYFAVPTNRKLLINSCI